MEFANKHTLMFVCLHTCRMLHSSSHWHFFHHSRPRSTTWLVRIHVCVFYGTPSPLISSSLSHSLFISHLLLPFHLWSWHLQFHWPLHTQFLMAVIVRVWMYIVFIYTCRVHLYVRLCVHVHCTCMLE